MLIGHYDNYREYLKDELARRAQANSRYSLRAFARDLGLSPQTLSAVLASKKNVSAELGIKLSHNLKHTLAETSYFHDLIELSQAKSADLKEVIQFRLIRYDANESYREIHQDVFKLVADWHHNAILELILTDDFKNDPAWIAKRLRISPIEVRNAVDRLVRLKLVELSAGILKRTKSNLTTSNDVPSAALKNVTEQFLEKASLALHQQPVEGRDFGTITMAIDPSKIPVAKAMIRKFRRELCKALETGSRSEVFTFATQLFRISHPTRGTSK